jgi:hypothetical protein
LGSVRPARRTRSTTGVIAGETGNANDGDDQFGCGGRSGRSRCDLGG